jgi:hypothetical protein
MPRDWHGRAGGKQTLDSSPSLENGPQKLRRCIKAIAQIGFSAS